ncbi:MAG: hypothetical protein IJR07_00840 [Bacteroidaceae bacterium]|nr:hypothetical protein [Bacteroidaceae bacterium]
MRATNTYQKSAKGSFLKRIAVLRKSLEGKEKNHIFTQSKQGEYETA